MKLIDDWRVVLRKAWCLRLAIGASVLSAAEVGVQLMAPSYPGPWFAAGATILCLVATWARLVHQASMHRGK